MGGLVVEHLVRSKTVGGNRTGRHGVLCYLVPHRQVMHTWSVDVQNDGENRTIPLSLIVVMDREVTTA